MLTRILLNPFLNGTLTPPAYSQTIRYQWLSRICYEIPPQTRKRLFGSQALATYAEWEQGIITKLLTACGDGDTQWLRAHFLQGADVNGMDLDAVLCSLDGRARRYRFGGQLRMLSSSVRSRTLAFTYDIGPSDLEGSALVELALSGDGKWQIKRLARVSASLGDSATPCALAINPLRNIFVGANHRQEILLVTTASGKSVPIGLWKGVLQTETNSYDVAVRATDILNGGKTIWLELDIPADLSARADLTEQRKAVLVLTCKMPGNTDNLVINLPVRTYDNTRHRAIHANLIDARRLGLNPSTVRFDEFRVRFRVLDLSATYYACMRFRAGYAGLQYNSGASVYAHWFSLWNSPDGGWDKRNRFRGIGPKEDGWVTTEVPIREHGDKNYTGIRNMTAGWSPGVEYTYVLTVEPVRDDEEDWTKVALTAIEHSPTTLGEPEKPTRILEFGAMLYYGDLRLTYCNAFMEALGRSLNYQRRQMEFVRVFYRTHGATDLKDVDLGTITTDGVNDDGKRDRYPTASWMARGRLRLSSGGQTPLRPGELLLDY